MFFNFNLYKIFYLFLVDVSLYFFNFNPYKCKFMRIINEKNKNFIIIKIKKTQI